MADHSKPTTTSTYVNFVSELDGRLDDISLGLDPATTSPTNLTTNAIRWTSASNKWQKYNGTTWNDLSSAYSINIDGTVGATTPASGAFTTLSATGNVTLGDASGDAVTINGTVGAGVVISGSTATDALRITQTGAGNALVVEDSANPDSTPFVVDSSGVTIVGGTTSIGAGQTTNIQSQSTGGSAGVSAFRFSNDTIPPRIQVGKSRGTTVGSYTAVQSGDSLGGLYFYGADGTNIVPQGASIIGQVDGSVSTGSIAGRIIFNTTLTGDTNPTERMRITSNGQVTISSSSPNTSDIVQIGTVNTDIGIITSSTINGITLRYDAPATATTQRGFNASFNGADSGTTYTTNNVIGGYFGNYIKGTNQTVTNGYGVYIDNVDYGSTTNYGIFISASSGATNNYGIYQSGASVNNYFQGNVGIGTTSPAVKLAVSSTDAILVPVGTTAQRPTGATGYIRYNTSTSSFEGHNGTAWGNIGGGATGGGTDTVFYLNSKTVSTTYSIPSGQNASCVGPITVSSGATVTVPSGSRWVVL